MAGINFVRRYVMSQMTKKADDGIMITLPDSSKVDLNVNITMDRLLRNGFDPDAFTNPQQVDNAINMINSRMVERAIPANSAEGREITEKIFGKQKAPVFDLEGNRIPEGEGIMGGKSIKSLMDSGQVTKGARGMKKSKKVEDREMFQAANERLTSDVDTIVKNIKRLSPMDAMKEANLVIGRKGYYKNLSPEESKKILKDTEDHIFERNIPEEDFAKGGRAGFKGGGADASKSDFKTSSSQSTNRERGIMSRGKGPKGTTGNINNTGGGGGNNNTGGGGGGGPPSTNTGGGGPSTTTTQSNFKELIKQKQIIDRLRSLGLLEEEDFALTGASKVGKGLYKYLTKSKSDKPGYNFGVDDFDILNPGKADIYGNYFNRNFLTDSDFKIGVKQNLKDAIKGEINPELELQKRLGNTNIKGTYNKDGDFNLGISIPLGNRPKSRNFKDRFAPDISNFNFEDMTGIPSQAPADMQLAMITDQQAKEIDKASKMANLMNDTGKLTDIEKNTIFENAKPFDDKGSKGVLGIGAREAEPMTREEFDAYVKEKGYADGGRANFVGGGMGRRGFLKMLAGLGGGIAAAKTGLLKFAGKEPAKQVAKEVAKEATSTYPPPYFFKLVEKIKFMGDDALATTDKAIAKKYKDYTMEEDFAGNIEIIKKGDDVAEDVYMSYKVDEVPLRGKKGSRKVEEYEEYTARPDAEGKMKDIEQGVPDEVIDEAGDPDSMTIKKADGGRIPYFKGGLAALKTLMNYFAKEKGVTGSKLLSDINPKKLDSGIKNLMSKEELNQLKENRTEYVKYLLNIIKSDKKFLDNNRAIVEETIAQAPIGMKEFAKEISDSIKRNAMKENRLERLSVYDKVNPDDAIIDVEMMIKNMSTGKDKRALNATGGRAGYQTGGDVSYDATDPIYGSSAATFTPDAVMDQFGNQVQAEMGNDFNKPLIPQVTEQASKQEGIMNSSPIVSQAGGTGEVDMPIAGGNKNEMGILPVMPQDNSPTDMRYRDPGPGIGTGGKLEAVKYNDPLPKDQLLSGFEEYKKINPPGAGTAAMVPVTLPGGYSHDFSGSAEANAFRKYLESIGQAPYQGRQDPGMLVKFASGGIARMLGE